MSSSNGSIVQNQLVDTTGLTRNVFLPDSDTSQEDNSDIYSGRSAVLGRIVSLNTGLTPGKKVQRA